MDNKFEHIDDALLMKFLLGESSEGEIFDVQQWLNADVQHQLHLDKLETIWLESGQLDPPPVPVSAAIAWDKVNTRIIDLEGQEQQKRKIISLSNVIRIAASLVVGIGLYLSYTILSKEEMIVEQALADITEIDLPDGSEIKLNQQASITYAEGFGKKERKLTLKGEAFFDVEPDKSKPFIIDAGQGSIKVLGTSFNVNALPNQPVHVNVITGVVELSTINPGTGDSLFLVLKAGEAGSIEKGKQPKPETIKDPDQLFWVDRTLVFKTTSVGKVLDIVKKYYNVEVQLEDTLINECTITANFTDATAEYILEVVAITLNLELIKLEKGYMLKGKGCYYEE
jgi:ferric-dicitrate binding protein FerR (iron transport regulator)